MTERKNNLVIKRALTAVAAVLVLAVISTGVAYAADIGGFRDTVTMWFRGEEKKIEVEEVGDGVFEYVDPDGAYHRYEAYTMDGEDGELLGIDSDALADLLLYEPEVVQDENGHYWLYFVDQKVDITSDLSESGKAYVKLEQDGEEYYFTVSGADGETYSISVSSDGFEK